MVSVHKISHMKKVWNAVHLGISYIVNFSPHRALPFFNKAELHCLKHFSIDDGYLIHKGQVCVLRDIATRRQILKECHDSPSTGHQGIRKTYALVRRQ